MSIAKISDLLMGLAGKRGITAIDDETVTTGKWVKIVVIEECSFTTLTLKGWSGDVPEDIPARTIILGDITAITLSKGRVHAYNR